jgi:hypothetical protein
VLPGPVIFVRVFGIALDPGISLFATRRASFVLSLFFLSVQYRILQVTGRRVLRARELGTSSKLLRI